MNGVIIALAAIAAAVGVSPGAPGAPQEDGVTWYVSIEGNDAWSGKRDTPNAEGTDGPFASVSRAVQAARDLKSAQGSAFQQALTIVLREGTHFLAEPLALGPDVSGSADCPVTFAAYPGERPVLSGGRRIANWHKVDERLWQADLDAVREGAWRFRILRVGDHWAVRARQPNFDPEQHIKGGWSFAQPVVIPKDKGGFHHGVGNIHNRGDRLEWNVTIAAEGEYVVWVRYGHKMKDYNTDAMDGRTRFGVADGESVALTDLADTGGWAATRWAKAATLRLPAGAQTLYWENVAGGGLDLDAFCLTDDPAWNPDAAIKILNPLGEYSAAPPAEGRHLLIIQAECFDKSVGKEVTVSAPSTEGMRDRLIMTPEAFPAWERWDGAELHIFPAWGWVNTITEIHGVDRDRATLRVNCPQDIRPGNRFFVAGAREALDGPGEWHLDQEGGTLLYWPVEAGFPDVEVVAPVHDALVRLEGDPARESYAEHIRLRGLTFMDSGYTLNHTYSPADAAICMGYARHCAVEDCTFTLLGGYAVRMEQGSCENEVVHNEMAELGQGGVLLVGDAATQAHDNLVAANTMRDLGRVYKHVAGVYVTTGSGNRIVHNRIHRVPRYGISLKSYGNEAYSHNNLVEFNELIDTNLETNDTGAIETLGRDRENTGNVIRHNLIRNVVGLKTSPEGAIMSPYFTWGIYLDDYSSGTTVYGNIVDGTVIGGVCIHGGKDNRIENNIFLNASSQQLRLQPRDDFMAGNTFLHNIVAYHAADSVLWYAYDRTWRPDRLSECDYNVYWCYGDLDIAGNDKAITPEGTFAAWQVAGLDAHSAVADPGFVSAALDHFALKPDSPALHLGFKPIPEDRIGPEGYRPDRTD